MTRKTLIVFSLSAVAVLSAVVAVWLLSGLIPAAQVAMATGEPMPAASTGTWLALFASLFGVPLSGGAAAIVAWLMKAAPGVLPVGPGGDSIRRVVNVGELGVYLYLASKATGAEKSALITAARALCDARRDEWFPVVTLTEEPPTP